MDSMGAVDCAFDYETKKKKKEIIITRSEVSTAAEDYKVLSLESVTKEMKDLICEVCTVLELSPTAVRVLLNKFGWNSEKLLDAFFDGVGDYIDKDGNLLTTYGIRVSSLVPLKRQKNALKEEKEVCMICFQDKSSVEMCGLVCGHWFCMDCWDQYLSGKLKDWVWGVGAGGISCAAPQCSILMEDSVVKKLVVDSEAVAKYDQFILNGFVESNRLMRWCPAPHCSKVIRVQLSKPQGINCDCGFKFCFKCSREWHEPVLCDWLTEWLRRSSKNDRTLNWITVNTKACPKCKSNIEKNGGCSHMTCRACSAEFCWMCLRDWRAHRGCNRYNGGPAEESLAARRASVERYKFYRNRYENHKESLKPERSLYPWVESKMENLRKVTSIDVQFLRKALDTLCHCRQTLMYTYVFAYYAAPNLQTAIFEDNQRDLEVAAEELSEYLQSDKSVTRKNLAKMKPKVVHTYHYCENRRKALVDHVCEGYEQNLWVYMEGFVDE